MQSLVLATMAEVISALSGNKRTPRKLDAGSRWARSWCDCGVAGRAAGSLPEPQRSSGDQQSPDEGIH